MERSSANYKLSGSDPNAFDLPLITYDKAGNIELLQRRSQSGALVDDLDYSYGNGNNQLTKFFDAIGSSSLPWDAEAGNFNYDENGNLISMTGNPSVLDITYEHRNLPVQIQLSGGATQIAAYNAKGQRTLKEVQTSGGTTWSFYIMDGSRNLGLIKNGELKYINIFGNGIVGRVIASAGAISVNGAKRYYIKDALGSVRAVVDQSGDVKENRDYGPWGVPMDERQYQQGSGTTEKFTGKELDQQTGWFHFGARVYSPVLGRWLSVDPKANKSPSLSPYNYTFNNPVNFFDPSGEFPITIYVRSFAPFKYFGPVSAWHGDNRGFSTSLSVSSRLSQTTFYETDTGVGYSTASGSFSASTYGAWAYSEASFSNGATTISHSDGSINTHLYGDNDAFFPAFGMNPIPFDGGPTWDIDVHSDLSIDVANGKNGNQILSITGTVTGDAFPNAEAFVSDAAGNALFLGVFSSNKGKVLGPLVQLGGDRKLPMINVNISIMVNDKGIFTGVKKGNKTYTIDEWNELF